MERELKTDVIRIVNEHAKKTKQKEKEIMQKKEEMKQKQIQQQKAEEYSARCRRERRIKSIPMYLGLGVIVFCIYMVGKSDMEVIQAEAEKNTTETVVESIMETRTIEAVLVGFDEETGDAILQTEDGHLWGLCDPPEVVYSVTFDTKGTKDVTDDVIVGLDCLE